MYNIIDSFLYHCEAKGLSKKTIKSYNFALMKMAQHFETKGITKIEDVKPTDIEQYIRTFNTQSKITVNGYIRDLKVFYSWATDFEYLSRNPFKIKQHKVERTPLPFVSDKDFKKLIQSMDKSRFPEYRDSVIVQTLLDTGMRIGETLSLKTFQINWHTNSILLDGKDTKSKKPRTVFFGEKTRKLLRQWIKHRDLMIEETDFLFPNQFGKEFHINTFERNLRMYQARVGLSDITPKTFRNNFAKRFLLNGGDIFMLSKILGHSSVSVTEKAYLDLTEEDIRKNYISPLEKM